MLHYQISCQIKKAMKVTANNPPSILINLPEEHQNLHQPLPRLITNNPPTTLINLPEDTQNINLLDSKPDECLTPGSPYEKPQSLHQPIPRLSDEAIALIISTQSRKHIDNFLKVLKLPVKGTTAAKKQALMSACMNQESQLPHTLTKFLVGKLKDQFVKEELARLKAPFKPSAAGRKASLVDYLTGGPEVPVPHLLSSDEDSESACSDGEMNPKLPAHILPVGKPKPMPKNVLPIIQPSPAPKVGVRQSTARLKEKHSKKSAKPKAPEPAHDLAEIVSAIKLLESAIIGMNGQLQRQESAVNLCLAGIDVKNKVVSNKSQGEKPTPTKYPEKSLYQKLDSLIGKIGIAATRSVSISTQTPSLLPEDPLNSSTIGTMPEHIDALPPPPPIICNVTATTQTPSPELDLGSLRQTLHSAPLLRTSAQAPHPTHQLLNRIPSNLQRTNLLRPPIGRASFSNRLQHCASSPNQLGTTHVSPRESPQQRKEGSLDPPTSTFAHASSSQPQEYSKAREKSEKAWPSIEETKSLSTPKEKTPVMSDLFPATWVPPPSVDPIKGTGSAPLLFAGKPMWASSLQNKSASSTPMPNLTKKAKPQSTLSAPPAAASKPNKGPVNSSKQPKVIILRDGVLANFDSKRFLADASCDSLKFETIRQALSDFARIQRQASGVDAFVIELGTNDLKDDSVDTVSHLLKQLVTQLRSSAPKARVIVSPPVIANNSMHTTKFDRYRDNILTWCSELRRDDPHLSLVSNNILQDPKESKDVFDRYDSLGIALSDRGIPRLLGCVRNAILNAFNLPTPRKRTSS